LVITITRQNTVEGDIATREQVVKDTINPLLVVDKQEIMKAKLPVNYCCCLFEDSNFNY
jgi:hypothetical protein